MKCLVLGGNGYIAQNLVRLILDQEGMQVISSDIQDVSAMPVASPHFTYLKGDVTSQDFLDGLDWNVDVIYFMAGLTGTRISVDQATRYVTVNELGLLHVLDRVRQLSTKPKIIFPSTRLVYQGMKGELPEHAAKSFRTVYAVNKFACESYLDIYRNLFGIDHTVFRICVPYGNIRGQAFSYGTIGMMIKQARAGEIRLYGDGALRRTFTHVQDIARIFLDAATAAGMSGEVFNIGGESFSLREVAELVARKYKARVAFAPWPEADLAVESGDTVFDDTKLRNVWSRGYLGSLEKWLDEYNLDQ